MEGKYSNIDYIINFSKKRRKTISILIKNGKIYINAPSYANKADCLKLLEEKKEWILRNIKNKKEFFNTNSLVYLGRNYKINIITNKLLSNIGFCKIKTNNMLYVYLPEKYDIIQFNNTIISWYKEKAEVIFKKRTRYFSNLYGFCFNEIKIRDLKSCWGSCNHKNIIKYNWKAVTFDISCIDYLIVHELSHTIQKNHSEKFWNIVKKIIPNYKELRKKMK